MFLAGSEYRAWLLFYSLPVMSGILSPCCFNHFILLVAALHILYSDYIGKEDLNTAEKYLKDFYVKFSELYGKKERYHC